MKARVLLLCAPVLLLLLIAPPAFASCHAFTVTVNPATVTEGATVTATVARDGEFPDSSVEVVSINETARSGQDYGFVQRTVSFTGNETEQTFTVSTIENSTHETNETFRLHLSNGDGCLPPFEFSYGPDARVTIQDDDAAATGSPTTGASPTPARTQTATPSPTPSATGSATAGPTPTTSTSPTPVPSQTPSDTPTLPEPTSSEIAAGPGEESIFSSGRVTVMIAGALLLAGAAAGLLALFRGRPQL